MIKYSVKKKAILRARHKINRLYPEFPKITSWRFIKKYYPVSYKDYIKQQLKKEQDND